MAKANSIIIKVQPRQYSTSNFAMKSSLRKKAKQNKKKNTVLSDYQIIKKKKKIPWFQEYQNLSMTQHAGGF